MKRALIVIASVGILAVTVAMESANAQVTRPYRAPPQPGSQGAGWNGLREGHGWNGLGVPRTLTTPDSSAATGWGILGNNQFWKWKWE